MALAAGDCLCSEERLVEPCPSNYKPPGSVVFSCIVVAAVQFFVAQAQSVEEENALAKEQGELVWVSAASHSSASWRRAMTAA